MPGQEPCPFKPGEFVIYRPTQRGRDLDIMFAPSGQLVSGQTYRVQKIEKEFYVLVEGYDHPSGGVYWTEFAKSS
jgi:hypothetical protein